MNYVILDMEWNQPFPKKKILQIPIKLYGEIVQIAAVKIDENLQQLDTFNEIVKPIHYVKMDRDVSELTEITDEILATGRPFQEVVGNFKDWLCEDDVLMTWGDEDIKMLEDNLIVHDMDYAWIPAEVDAQILFDDLVTQEDRTVMGTKSYNLNVLAEDGKAKQVYCSCPYEGFCKHEAALLMKLEEDQIISDETDELALAYNPMADDEYYKMSGSVLVLH